MDKTKTPTYQLVSRQLGKDAAKWIDDRRREHKSWRWISLHLLEKYNANITEVTIRRWWLSLPEDKRYKAPPKVVTMDEEPEAVEA